MDRIGKLDTEPGAIMRRIHEDRSVNRDHDEVVGALYQLDVQIGDILSVDLQGLNQRFRKRELAGDRVRAPRPRSR
jgi:hypothetical protein